MSDIKCDKCPKHFKDHSSLRRHQYGCPSGPRATCPSCNKSFANRGSLATHKWKIHSKRAVRTKGNMEEKQMDNNSRVAAVETKYNTLIGGKVKAEENSRIDQTSEMSVRDECKARMFGFMWRGLSNDRSTPYRMLDAYQIKKRFFQNLHSFFDFKLETILNDREQALVSAILETDGLEECKNILNENLDVFVGILAKANAWFEC